MEVIKSSDAEKEFKGARFGVDLAIYVLTEKGGFDLVINIYNKYMLAHIEPQD